jgi:hypothetical protein
MYEKDTETLRDELDLEKAAHKFDRQVSEDELTRLRADIDFLRVHRNQLQKFNAELIAKYEEMKLRFDQLSTIMDISTAHLRDGGDAARAAAKGSS